MYLGKVWTAYRNWVVTHPMAAEVLKAGVQGNLPRKDIVPAKTLSEIPVLRTLSGI